MTLQNINKENIFHRLAISLVFIGISSIVGIIAYWASLIHFTLAIFVIAIFLIACGIVIGFILDDE